MKLLKIFVHELAPKFIQLFNYIIKTGSVPRQWKTVGIILHNTAISSVAILQASIKEYVSNI